MRLAGTWRQYSKKAIAQLTRIAIHSDVSRCRRWPYHAMVMNTLDASKSRMVRMESRARAMAAMLRLAYHARGFRLEAFMRGSSALLSVLAVFAIGCGDDGDDEGGMSGDGGAGESGRSGEAGESGEGGES